MKKPQICILQTDGTNCHEETAYAFTLAGGEPHIVHVNALREGRDHLTNYQILALAGGFSYGDDVASGKVLAVELISFLGDQLQAFVEASKLVIGICNGFQVLVQTGLLPFRRLGDMRVTLAHNDSGHFQCEWVNLMPVPNGPCVFTRDFYDRFTLQMAHGEGRFLTDDSTLMELRRGGLVPLEYFSPNPNGSMDHVAGLCDPSGRIFGLMPHPERFVHAYQHPNWRRSDAPKPKGLHIFENAVKEAALL